MAGEVVAIWSAGGAGTRLVAGCWWVICAIFVRRATSTPDAFIESRLIWGGRQFKQKWYPIFGRPFYYMSFFFLGWGLLEIAIAVAQLSGSSIESN